MAYKTETVTMGTGKLYVNGEDVGYLAGDVTFHTTGEVNEFKTGCPRKLVKQKITEMSNSITAKLAQIDMDTLKTAIGFGQLESLSGSSKRLKFGKIWEIATLENVVFVHERDDGTPIWVYFPKAQVKPGSAEINFGESDWAGVDVEILAVESQDSEHTEFPLGFIQEGDADLEAALSAGNGGSSGGNSGGENQGGESQGDSQGGSGGTEVTEETLTISNHAGTLAHSKISDVTVKSADGQTTYTKGTDYDYASETGVVTLIETGSAYSAESLKVSYTWHNSSTEAQSEEVTSVVNGESGLRWSLAHNPVENDSHHPIVQSSDGQTTYTEGDDYTVNYDTGEIYSVAEGSLTESPITLAVTYYYYT